MVLTTNPFWCRGCEWFGTVPPFPCHEVTPTFTIKYEVEFAPYGLMYTRKFGNKLPANLNSNF